MDKYDFGGWATRNNIKCSDGRIIRKDAFKANDGGRVPLVWNHEHNSPDNVLGHAVLENRKEGVYAYCTFNDSETGQNAKQLVQHGDVCALSIYANRLKQANGPEGRDVLHGQIREVSLVLAGANPGAFIDTVMVHGDGEDAYEEAEIYNDCENELELSHADEESEEKEPKKEKQPEVLTHAEDTKETKTVDKNEDKTVQDVVNTMNDEQLQALYYLVGAAAEEGAPEDDSEGEEGNMKHNAFEEEEYMGNDGVLTHSDQEAILEMARTKSVGSLKEAMELYAEQDGSDHLSHGIAEIETLFPEFKDLKPGAPELLTRDMGWVDMVMTKVHKSPFSRVRVRHADSRIAEIKALGYKKGAAKKNMGNIKLLSRTTDPQTVYVKDALNRDDIIDITDFDAVEYNFGVMRMTLNEEIAKAIMIGDGREEGDEDKISEEHIRPIYTDDALFTIRADVDLVAAKKELQGTNTSANFSDNYVYSEAIIQASLYAREKYKGKGGLDFYCTPHLLNVMLLARDLNGRRIYNSKADLEQALNVNSIQTVEQFEGVKRTVDGTTKNLLGIYVNVAQDYQVGSTKGGEITRFDQFDIDYNRQKMLLETRLSGALVNPYSAIVLEEPVATTTGA